MNETITQIEKEGLQIDRSFRFQVGETYPAFGKDLADATKPIGKGNLFVLKLLVPDGSATGKICFVPDPVAIGQRVNVLVTEAPEGRRFCFGRVVSDV